jgi:hypothetical protein
VSSPGVINSVTLDASLGLPMDETAAGLLRESPLTRPWEHGRLCSAIVEATFTWRVPGYGSHTTKGERFRGITHTALCGFSWAKGEGRRAKGDRMRVGGGRPLPLEGRHPLRGARVGAQGVRSWAGAPGAVDEVPGGVRPRMTEPDTEQGLASATGARRYLVEAEGDLLAVGHAAPCQAS